jgi:hypothetical protein
MDDLRIPIGFFFSLLGLILLAVAFFDPGARAPMASSNVNLYTGLAMLAFGAVMLALAKRAK